MGFDAERTGAMTPWELLACYDGWARSTGRKDSNSASKPMSVEKMKDLGIEGF